MPKSTNHEYPQLRNSSTFERGALINTFSQPLLNCNIPMWNFASNVFICLSNHWTASINKFKFLTIEWYSTCMDRCYTEFPSKVIFKSNQCDTNEWIK